MGMADVLSASCICPEAFRVLPTNPRSLPKVLLQQVVDDTTPAWVMSVHIGEAVLVPSLAHTGFEMHLKYGRKGRSHHRGTAKVWSTEGSEHRPPSANFDTDFAFLWHSELMPVIRFRLVQLGVIDQLIAKAEFEIPSCFGNPIPGVYTRQLPLSAKKNAGGAFLGVVWMTVELKSVSKGKLLRGLRPQADFPKTAKRAKYGCEDNAQGRSVKTHVNCNDTGDTSTAAPTAHRRTLRRSALGGA